METTEWSCILPSFYMVFGKSCHPVFVLSSLVTVLTVALYACRNYPHW